MGESEELSLDEVLNFARMIKKDNWKSHEKNHRILTAQINEDVSIILQNTKDGHCNTIYLECQGKKIVEYCDNNKIIEVYNFCLEGFKEIQEKKEKQVTIQNSDDIRQIFETYKQTQQNQ